MPRFITVNLRCDWPDCTAIAEEGEGAIVSKTLSIDGKQAREFLVCKIHRDQLDEFLAPLMAAGVKVEPPKKPAGTRRSGSGTSTDGPSSSSDGSGSSSSGTDGPVNLEMVCRVPDCERDGRPLKSNVGLAQHVIRSHGYESLSDYKAQYGLIESVATS